MKNKSLLINSIIKFKRLMVFCMTMSLGTSAFCQIVYEHSYPVVSEQWGFFFPTDIGYNNYKYVLYDNYADQINLYNLDHTLYMNIQVPVSSDTGLNFSVGFITLSLFDCDSSTLEYALMPEKPIYPFRVYRTDGTLLFSKDSVYGWWCYGCQEASTEIRTIVNTPVGTKLYLQYPWTGPNPDSVLVYSLCGTLPANITEINNNSGEQVRVNPNPASDEINFEFLLTTKNSEYELTIFNSSYQPIKIQKLKGIKQLTIKTNDIASGVYFYSLRCKNKIAQTGKIVLIK